MHLVAAQRFCVSKTFVSNHFIGFLIFFALTSQDIASGTSVDWVYATQNVPLAYTFEFRDSRNGECFFYIQLMINPKHNQLSLHRSVRFRIATKSNYSECPRNDRRHQSNAQRSQVPKIFIGNYLMITWISGLYFILSLSKKYIDQFAHSKSMTFLWRKYYE